MPITLGLDPDQIKVNLTRGGSFRATIEATDADGGPVTFPDGTVIQLRFENSGTSAGVWPATINGNVITWDVPAETVALATGASRASLWIVSGDGRAEPWFLGSVARHG